MNGDFIPSDLSFLDPLSLVGSQASFGLFHDTPLRSSQCPDLTLPFLGGKPLSSLTHNGGPSTILSVSIGSFYTYDTAAVAVIA